MMRMDKITFTAFNQLWTLYKEHQSIRPESAAEWDSVVDKAREIVECSGAADDPEFISDFAVAVLSSLDRISQKPPLQE